MLAFWQLSGHQLRSSAPSYFAQLKQRLDTTTTVGVTVSPPTHHSFITLLYRSS